jgi:hypothetical protein
MSYHGKLQTLKNGTADAEIQQWAFDNLAVAEINFENAERIIEEQKAQISELIKHLEFAGIIVKRKEQAR